MAPAQATAPAPDLTRAYLELMQRNRAADEIDRGMAGLAAAFAAPGTAGAVSAPLMPHEQDAGAQIKNLMELQQYGIQQQAMARGLMPGGGIDQMGINMGLKPGALPDMIRMNPAILDDVIKSSTGMSLPLDQRQYLQQQREAQASGKPFPTYPEWASSNAAVGTAKETQAREAQQFKDTGSEDFTAANQKLNENEARVAQLLKNPDATMEALSKPDVLTTSKAASWIPSGTPIVGASDAAKQQAIAIQKLMAELTGEGLQSAKNVRTQREFGTLGEALTAGLNVNNGKQGVIDALADIQKKFATAHAQVYAVAGKQIPYQYGGLADPKYTSPTWDGQPNPYYTGATYEEPPKEEKDKVSFKSVEQPTATHRYNPATGKIEPF
jgi:hypothetical protein